MHPRPLTLLQLVGALALAACGGDEPATAVEVPPWAKVAPEQIAEAKKHGVPVAFEHELGMRFVLSPAGTFVMGVQEDAIPSPVNSYAIPSPVNSYEIRKIPGSVS